MKTLIKLILIVFLVFPFIQLRISAEDKKEELKPVEELTGCDLTDNTIPPYLLDSEINYENSREKRDSAPASFSWKPYMPPIRVHQGGPT